MPADREIRLLVADDHEIIRQGVKSLLADTEIKVVAEAATGKCAVRYVIENDFDIALLDVRMPDGGGLEGVKRIKVEKPNFQSSCSRCSTTRPPSPRRLRLGRAVFF